MGGGRRKGRIDDPAPGGLSRPSSPSLLPLGRLPDFRASFSLSCTTDGAQIDLSSKRLATAHPLYATLLQESHQIQRRPVLMSSISLQN